MGKNQPEDNSEIEGERFHRFDPIINLETVSPERARRVREGAAECIKELGSVITIFRNLVGETREDFASACGVSVPFIYLIEAGLADPQYDEVCAMAHHMGLSAFELMRVIDPNYLGDNENDAGAPEAHLE